MLAAVSGSVVFVVAVAVQIAVEGESVPGLDEALDQYTSLEQRIRTMRDGKFGHLWRRNLEL